MTLADSVLLAAAGLTAGAVNAIAGGGTLISFPALLATGVSPITANITSSVGLLSGYLGGSIGYRRELAGQGRRIRALVFVGVVGGLVGAVVLLLTPASAFETAVPVLILVSCALLAVQPRLARMVAARRAARPGPAPGSSWAVRAGVLVSAVYGSYFGAGLGVLLLAVLGILVHDELQRLNALKGLLSLVVNIVGVVVFIGSGRVAWAAAGILCVAAYTGGLLGVRLARRLPAPVLRTAVVALGTCVAVVLLMT